MKIASFNTNGIRARMPIVLGWLDTVSPDVLCLQETKVQDADFPEKPLRDIGYHCSFSGQKSYNGVAVLSRSEPETVRIGFAGEDPLEVSRLIAVRVDGVDIVNSYIPQGQAPDSEKFAYKLDWFARLRGYFEQFYSPEDALVWVGDFNVAPEPFDVYDPEKLQGSVGFHPEEHRALAQVKAWGFEDVYRYYYPREKAYTFWDYRVPNGFKRGLGWRIDHIWATRAMTGRAVSAWIDPEPRGFERPSDHTFIVADFK